MILITGATGHIGRHVIARLMDLNQPLRVLISQDDLSRISWDQQAEHAPEIIIGSLMDDEAVFQAVSGVYVILHLENAMWWGRRRDLERVELVGSRNLIASARAARVGRIITLSHLGASPSSGFTLLRIKGQFESLIKDSGLAYTIIRPGIVFGPEDAFVNHIAMVMSVNPFFYLLPGIGEVVLHPLHIQDLVEAIIRSLSQLNTVDEVIEIGGPEYITLVDLLQTVMRVTGIGRYIVSVPPYAIRYLTRILNIVFRRTLVTQQWLDYLASNRTAPLGNTYRIFGFHPRRFEDTLMTYLPQRRFFWPAVAHAFKRRPRGI
jgi:uncharacterized protein YbjT (DUF2867 family)